VVDNNGVALLHRAQVDECRVVGHALPHHVLVAREVGVGVFGGFGLEQPVGHGARKLALPAHVDKDAPVSLMTLRLAALSALLPLLVAYADTPWRTFGQRYVAHRWPERMVLFSIELNLLLLWA